LHDWGRLKAELQACPTAICLEIRGSADEYPCSFHEVVIGARLLVIGEVPNREDFPDNQ